MRRRLIYIFAPVLYFVSCSNFANYNEQFYKKISHIEIPKKAKVIKSIDNMEFVTTTVFDATKVDLNKFMSTYKFTRVRPPFYYQLVGNPYLGSDGIDLVKVKNLFFSSGSMEKNSWLYFVDMDSKRIWAEIRYPDMAGN